MDKYLNKIINDDCLKAMREIPDDSIDAVITDPPYELGFMGKSWDSTGIANNVEVWSEALRVLKPGGHLLAFSGTRTYHRMAVAIEDAGFEVRDMIEWVYGSGFPKSLNIGKAVDKLRGNEREKVSSYRTGEGANFKHSGNGKEQFHEAEAKEIEVSKGTSEWEGWGTALKPAHEPICMARKPLAEKTVAENVLKYGTGGINIDESRVDYTSEKDKKEGQSARPSKTSNANEYALNHGGLEGMDRSDRSDIAGRFPANLIHDNSEEVRECFPESNSGNGKASTYEKFGGQWGKGTQIRNEDYGDSGNASRFFKSIIYQAKASKSERNKGCEELEEKQMDTGRKEGNPGGDNPRNRGVHKSQNNHPTVKPTALMEYLINMVSREGQTILDPFAGSGTTGIAAKNLKRNFILIEKEKEYCEIADKRISEVAQKLF